MHKTQPPELQEGPRASRGQIRRSRTGQPTKDRISRLKVGSAHLGGSGPVHMRLKSPAIGSVHLIPSRPLSQVLALHPLVTWHLPRVYKS